MPPAAPAAPGAVLVDWSGVVDGIRYPPKNFSGEVCSTCPTGWLVAAGGTLWICGFEKHLLTRDILSHWLGCTKSAYPWRQLCTWGQGCCSLLNWLCSCSNCWCSLLSLNVWTIEGMKNNVSEQNKFKIVHKFLGKGTKIISLFKTEQNVTFHFKCLVLYWRIYHEQYT